MAEEDIHLCTEPMDGEYEMSENGGLYSSKGTKSKEMGSGLEI
jgi:hypothetical protein